MFDNPAKRPEVKEKMRLAKLGKRGSEVNNWQGGLTEEKRKLRNKKRSRGSPPFNFV